MGNYVKKPHKTRIVEHVIEKHPSQQEMDVDKLAKAVADALAGQMPKVHVTSSGSVEADSFNSSRSLEEIAKSMLVQRGNKNSNFEDLGRVEETQKDQEEVNRTIDLLSGLDD